MTENPRPRFRIRKLSDEEVERQKEDAARRANQSAAPPQEVLPEPDSPPAPEPTRAEEPETQTGALFRTAGQMLGFLGLVASNGLTDTATLQRGPKTGWWTQLQLHHDRLRNLIDVAGGVPYALVEGSWHVVSPTGDVSENAATDFDIGTWAQVDLSRLLGETALHPGRYVPTAVVNVLTPGSIARWILHRAAGLGLEVSLTPVICDPFEGDSGEPFSAVNLRLSSATQTVSSALIRSLVRLPYTLVFQPPQESTKGLMVDVRHRLPCPPELMNGFVNEGEFWVIGPPDLGRWRLRADGEEINAASLLRADDVVSTAIAPPSTGSLPIPPKVRLVRRPSSSRSPEAFLLDAQELKWLRSWLRTRPLEETAFILPGEERWILLSPGGFNSAVPFGIPLVRVGIDALFVEAGVEFFPLLPEIARRESLSLSNDHVVVLTEGEGWRFERSGILPAWRLWVGDLPSVEETTAPNGHEILTRISTVYSRQEKEAAMALDGPRHPLQLRRVEPHERDRLLESAMEAYLNGEMVRAAEELERAGFVGHAGRLYEAAAMNGDAASRQEL